MFRDLTGQRFGRLIVLGRDGKNEHRAIKWKCQCDCGNQISTLSQSLLSGHTKSCGCLHKDIMTKHGGKDSRLYHVWQSMKRRCNSPNSTSYMWYGAKGVKVCEEWESFEPFRKWAIASGYDENAERGICTLDRIDSSGNYEPSNCRWVSIAEQNRNMRKKAKKVKMDIGSKIKQAMNLRKKQKADLSRDTGLTMSAISHYINNDRTPRSDDLLKICLSLYVSSDWILGISDNMEPICGTEKMNERE